MALNGTTWYLNTSITVSSSLDVTIDFTSNGTSYTRFRIYQSALRYYRNQTNTYAYRYGSWQGNYRLVTFSGNNTSLETWLNSNAIRLWNLSNSVVGNGQGIVERNENTNVLTLNAIAEEGNRFVKHVINGTDYTTKEMTFTMNSDTTIVTHFEGIKYYSITLDSSIKGLTPYQSDYSVEEGETIEIRARELNGFKFVGWSDGNTDTEREITVTSDIKLTAQYQRIISNETYYQYRGFIKDQLDLEAKPKSWILTKSDTDIEDLLTKATSTINVQEVPSNVNEGDILVLYTPKGYVYYQGVVNKISGTKITCSQMASFLKGTFNKSICNHLTATSLEGQIKEVIEDYFTGVYFGTDYVDNIIKDKYSGFTIQSTASQSVNLPTDLDDEGNDKNTSYDMEQFIYDCYEQYGVIVEFEVNVEGNNYIRIFTPTYTQITVGNNQNAITNLSPITTVEETNKLIIFNKDGTYRTTFIARKDGEIVEEPVLNADRFEIVNTKIVKSSSEDDSDNEDLIASNLPQKMYNHLLSFSLNAENDLYDWKDFKLGMPLHIFIDNTYFDTVLTHREIIHNENQNIKEIRFKCGFVRVSLTDTLLMKYWRN